MSGAGFLADHEDRLAWILGSSRSGSTWLCRMLGSLEAAACVDDPHLGHHLGVWRPLSLAWGTAEDPPRLATLRELKHADDDYFFSDRYRDAWMPALRELIRSRFGAQLDDAFCRPTPPAGAALFIKEPGSQAAPLLFELFPRSRLIFLLRDGRDVVDSWLDAYERDSWAIPGGAFVVAREGREALIRWLAAVWAYRARAVAEVFAGRPEGHRVLVRYEDLLADPRRELERICEMLELPPGDLDGIAEQHSFERIPQGERGSGRAARAACPGRWQTSMSEAEQRAMEEALGATLSTFGYSVAQPALLEAA